MLCIRPTLQAFAGSSDSLLAKCFRMTQYHSLERQVLQPHLYQGGIACRSAIAVNGAFYCSKNSVTVDHLPSSRCPSSPSIFPLQHFLIGIYSLERFSFRLRGRVLSGRPQFYSSALGFHSQIGSVARSSILRESFAFFWRFKSVNSIVHTLQLGYV